MSNYDTLLTGEQLIQYLMRRFNMTRSEAMKDAAVHQPSTLEALLEHSAKQTEEQTLVHLPTGWAMFRTRTSAQWRRMGYDN